VSIREVTEWLTANQLLVFSLVLPTFSAGVAWVASYFSVKRTLKSERLGREHTSTLEISRFRQVWINNLRDAIAEFGAITSVSDSWIEHKERVVGLVFKIELMMNPLDPDYNDLKAALKYRADAQALGGTKKLDPKNDSLLEISQRILKREWDRLKGDLARIECEHEG
jgi:hypothetical protein